MHIITTLKIRFWKLTKPYSWFTKKNTTYKLQPMMIDMLCFVLSVSSIFHWYQTKVSQIVSCNIFRFRFRGLFTFFALQSPAASKPALSFFRQLALSSAGLSLVSTIERARQGKRFEFVNKVFKKSTKIQKFAKIMRLKDEVYW